MDKVDLIRRGYFPKEMPPAFNTNLLSDNIEEVTKRWQAFYDDSLKRKDEESRSKWKSRKNKFWDKYSSSKCADFSISKGNISRRVLKIPNPKHFLHLADLISNNWNKYNSIYQKSNYSHSYPVFEEDLQKRSVLPFSKSVNEFRNTLLKKSVNKSFLIRVDISKFYPSIYTHSITWSFLGKKKAKDLFAMSQNEFQSLCESEDSDALLYQHADELDKAVRACQDKQSIGIPIGPDTSHLISEVIASSIDKKLASKYSEIDLVACRFYDDYYLYVNTLDEADQVLKGLQRILNSYQLEINESKVSIKKFPFAFENEWVTDIFRFEFKETNIENSLKHYFSLIWNIARENSSRTDWIFKYALKIFEYKSINLTQKSWKIFEVLILKSALIEPAVLDIVTKILLSYQNYLDYKSRRKIKKLIESIITEHAQMNHHFEVSWALWLARTFNILISEKIANLVIELDDVTSNLILLCMAKEEDLVLGNPDYSKLSEKLKGDVLFSEYWLLAYESIKRGWLSSEEENLIENNGYFSILDNLDIYFFDKSKQISPFPTTDKDTGEADDYAQIESKNTELEQSKNDKDEIFFEEISNIL